MGNNELYTSGSEKNGEVRLLEFFIRMRCDFLYRNNLLLFVKSLVTRSVYRPLLRRTYSFQKKHY